LSRTALEQKDILVQVGTRQAPAMAPKDLATLMPDWQISLRAKCRQPGTILSYLNVARPSLVRVQA
jgi:hypothetical protein